MTDVRPSRSGDDVRAALLDAAHDLLANEGPSALTVRGIAAAAGVSTMNVYSRFGGKDGVLDALYVDGFGRLAMAMNDVVDTDDAVVDLRGCGERYRRFARENPTYYALMFDHAVTDFVPSPAAEEAALAALGQLVARVDRAMKDGQFRPGDPFVIAGALWSSSHGVISLETKIVGPKRELFDWEAIGDELEAGLLRGFAAD